MFTINGWGTTLYGSARRQELDAAATEFALHHRLPPYSYQAVKWFTAAFLPIVPLGIYRTIKIKQGPLLFGSSEYVMEPVPWDSRQVLTHYAIGWFLPLAGLGAIFGLEMVDQHLVRRNIIAMPLAPFAFLSLVIGGLLFLLWWRTGAYSMRHVGPGEPRREVAPPHVLEPVIDDPPKLSGPPPIRARPAPSLAEPPARSMPRLIAGMLVVAALLASGAAILACAGGAVWVWHSAAESAREHAARAGQPVGHHTWLAKGTRLQVRRREWEDVEVLEGSEFGMVRVRWIGRRGPRNLFVPRSQLRWPR